MGLSEDGDGNTEQRFDELCLDLNMDSTSKEEAWISFERISQNYTLEGDSLHWLACALYVSCRKSVIPTVGRGVMKGNCVSLTRLLRSGKLSLIEFFKKMKKWSDMASIPQEFRHKVDKLERNFAVSTVIFKKFRPIFMDIFCDPANDQPRAPRGRKQKRLPCTVSDVFNFAWTAYVKVKGNFPAISDDLVNSYHLLLCSLDWLFANALLSNRRDLINAKFSGLPDGFMSRDYKPPTEVPCILHILCDKHEGLLIEAKGIKEHWWKPYIKKLFDRMALKGKVDNLAGVLEIGNFESNNKSMNHAYEEYVLQVGDFDERIFLGDAASEEIGTPAKTGACATGELRERMEVSKNLRQHFDETRSLAPSTPLTGRRYLKEKDGEITPVSTATQSVSRLQTLLSGRKTSPSDQLTEIFNACSRNPTADILQRIQEMGQIFCTKYAQPNGDHPGSQLDFAKKRLQLAESLYFKALENIMLAEKRRVQAKENKNLDFSTLLEQDIFHRSLFACCLEIVIFSYNSQRVFPWIMDIFELQPYYFYKVMEVLIRAEEGLSRDVVKHLNHIEECILEFHAWKSDSPLWDALEQLKQQRLTVPSVEEVSFSNQIEKECGSSASSDSSSAVTSPLVHPALRRVVAGVGVPRRDNMQSPTGTVTERFSSPAPGNAKRRLFTVGAVPGGSTTLTPIGASVSPATVPSAQPQSPPSGGTPGGASAAEGAGPGAGYQVQSPSRSTAYQVTQSQDGRQIKLIPVQVIHSPTPTTTTTTTTTRPAISLLTNKLAAGGIAGIDRSQTEARPSPEHNNSAQCPTKPRRTGSLALFLRKVYHLASVRLQDLCERLDIDHETCRQMWTCFEYTLISHTEMMRDRHLDQLIMSAVYVMCKVAEKDRAFQDVMRCYRYQPQAQSHVYRSVLLSSRRRHSSGASDSSQGSGASGGASGASERPEPISSIRSSSTLPTPQPNSQPPTPTRLAGSGANFEFEDRGERRGDLIQFYNTVYVSKIKQFALKFSAHNKEQGNEFPLLSPLPVTRAHPLSPRRVSSKHCVYVSPHKNRLPCTPQSKMLYCFNRSPAKDLRAINNMLRMNEQGQRASKRLLQDEGGAPTAAETASPGSASAGSPAAGAAAAGGGSAKRLCVDNDSSPFLQRRLERIVLERQANTGDH